MNMETPQGQEKQQEFIETPESLYRKFNDLAERVEAEKGTRFENYDEKTGIGDRYIQDADGKRLYEIKYKVKNPKDPKQETEWYYDKSFEYDENGHLKSEVGSDSHADRQGNAWRKNFETTEQGEVSGEVGEITSGPDRGHKWQNQFSKSKLDDGADVFMEKGIILEQGENEKKEPAGHAWMKVRESKEGATMISGGKITGGPEEGRTWDQWDQLKSVQ